MRQQDWETSPDDHGPRRGPGRGALVRRTVGAVVATLVLAGVLTAVVGGVRTASGRFAATTTNEGSLLEAAAVDLQVSPAGGGAAVSMESLALDAANLVPGDVVQRCLVVGYRGAIDDVDVRMTGRIDGGTGLEEHLDAIVTLGSGTDPECSDFVGGGVSGAGGGAAQLFAGTLRRLGTDHADYATGLELISDAADGAAATVQIRVELRDDDRAQGLDTEFWFDLEVRP